MICTTAAPLKTKILSFNLFVTKILRKVLCVNLTICCWCLMIMCCLDEIGRFSYFDCQQLSIVQDQDWNTHQQVQTSKASKSHADLFVFLSWNNIACLKHTLFHWGLDNWVKALIDFVQICEVFVLMFTVFLYCILTVEGTMNESAY